MTVVEVFADVCCPFTHVGLRRFVARRAEMGRDDVVLRVRAWPLEIVNGTPLDPAHIDEEVVVLRERLGDDVFVGFDVRAFPSTSLPALALAAAAYRRDRAVGEAVSLEVRDLLFEQGVDIGDVDVLARVAARYELVSGEQDAAAVLADHAEGVERGVIGSPHFFTADGGFFCPALDVSRDADGMLRVAVDQEGFDRFVTSCFG